MENSRNTARKNFNWLGAAAALAFVLAAAHAADAQVRYNVGERVECDTIGDGRVWQPGTIEAPQKTDPPVGKWYPVKTDNDGVTYYCKVENIRRPADGGAPPAGANGGAGETRDRDAGDARSRPAAGAPTRQAGGVTTDADGTLSADRPILECPVKQPKARNGQRPDPELLKKVVRCSKGEQPASKGLDGAQTVEITAFEMGASRPWRPSRDIGDGRLGTTVYPAKVTYTVKRFYRTATESEENRVVVMYFYVNAMGEWRIASEDQIKSAEFKRVEKKR